MLQGMKRAGADAPAVGRAARRWAQAAGALACLSLAGLSLTACNQAAKETEAPPAPKKSIARQATMYAGQEQVRSVGSATAEQGPGGSIVITATATTAGPGWTQVGLLPRIYPATPPDGIYEIDVVGQKPAMAASAAPTTVEVKGGWSKYTDGRVKGVKLISKTNEVTAMVAPMVK